MGNEPRDYSVDLKSALGDKYDLLVQSIEAQNYKQLHSIAQKFPEAFYTYLNVHGESTVAELLVRAKDNLDAKEYSQLEGFLKKGMIIHLCRWGDKLRKIEAAEKQARLDSFVGRDTLEMIFDQSQDSPI